jgi:DNA repair protein SbcC/Rad50
MFIKKIKLSNIRSYENQEIEFLEGSTLLSGDIGSGKTSILLGIEFALFGLQPGQRGSSLLRNGANEGKVNIEFEIDGKNIIIERTLKKGKTISQDYCSIIIDNEKRELSVTELKNKVLELLNYPKEFSKKQNILYKFTVYTPQEEMKQIILQDPDTRINTLRHIFGIDKYKRILENISSLLSKIREEERNKEGLIGNLEQNKLTLFEKESDLETKNYSLTSIEKELFLKQEERKKIQDENDEILKKIEEKNKVQQEIEKTQIVISNKNEIINENKRSIKEIHNQIEELNKLSFNDSEIKEIEERLSFNKKEKEKNYQKNLEIISQINSINYKNEENNKIEQKFSNLEICPTCLQEVDAVYRANVLNSLHSKRVENNRNLENLKEEDKKILENIKKIDEDISLNEKKLQELNILKIKLQNIKEKQNRLEEFEKSNKFLEKDINLLEEHITTMNASLKELTSFEEVFREKKEELEKALREEKNYEIKVAELRKEIEVFSIQIEELKIKIEKTQQIKRQLDYLNELENWLSKNFVPIVTHIEKNVMTKLKLDFSKLFEEWFCMLVSDNFNIHLSDDFTPIIEQQDYEIDYTYLSGGERTAIALAYRLALNQVINSLLSKIKTKDLVILDEPTDGFSEQQLDKMRDVLQELNIKQLIVVSHEQKIEGFVENVVRLKKEKGKSKILYKNLFLSLFS